MRAMKWILGACLVAGLGATTVHGDEAGDPVVGQQLAVSCMGCHGVESARNAYPSYRVPKLGGQTKEYLVIALEAYRDGERDHATMRAQARGLSDQEIRDIAAYFAE